MVFLRKAFRVQMEKMASPIAKKSSVFESKRKFSPSGKMTSGSNTTEASKITPESDGKTWIRRARVMLHIRADFCGPDNCRPSFFQRKNYFLVCLVRSTDLNHFLRKRKADGTTSNS